MMLLSLFVEEGTAYEQAHLVEMGGYCLKANSVVSCMPKSVDCISTKLWAS